MPELILDVVPPEDSAPIDQHVGATREEPLVIEHAIESGDLPAEVTEHLDADRVSCLELAQGRNGVHGNRRAVSASLNGSTAPFAPAYRSKSLLNSQTSAVHVLVKASGKNASSTVRCPRYSERRTGVPAVESSEKSGASSPMRGGVDETVVAMVGRRGVGVRTPPAT